MTIANTLLKAVEAIRKGGVVIYPTDTVYGIGCDPFDVEAVNRVVEIKKREKKPAPVLVSDLEQLWAVADPTEEELEAALKLWPGAVTIVINRNPSLPDIVTGGEKTVGVRMPAHAIPLMIMRMARKPLIGTSANISGHPSATHVSQIDESVRKSVDVVIDAGYTYHSLPSTVVKIREGKVEVIREGAVKLEEIMRRLGLNNR